MRLSHRAAHNREIYRRTSGRISGFLFRSTKQQPIGIFSSCQSAVKDQQVAETARLQPAQRSRGEARMDRDPVGQRHREIHEHEHANTNILYPFPFILSDSGSVANVLQKPFGRDLST
jgi:hypothetical protein